MAIKMIVWTSNVHANTITVVTCPMCGKTAFPEQKQLVNDCSILSCKHCTYVFPELGGFLYTIPPEELVEDEDSVLTEEGRLSLELIKNSREETQTAFMSRYCDFMGTTDA